MDGVRFLYPGTGPGPGPGPVPTGADLTVDSVEASPEDAGPGDMVTVGYRLRNAGVTDAGSFKVSAYLTGGLVPKRTDPWLGSVAEAGLDVGASRTGGILADVPTGLLPGHYRFGVLVDSDNEVSERNEANNGGATDPLLEITRPPLTIGPGHLVQADLGPLGTDRFTLTLRAGMLIKLRASQDPGSLRLAMGPEGSEAALLDTGLKKVAKGKVDIPEDGPYVIRLTSESASFSRYELLVRTKKMKTKSIEEVAGEIRIPFRVYRGSRVKAIVTGRKGFHPEAEIEGLEVPMKTTKKKVKLGAFDAEANGELTLVVRPADGEPGSAKCIIRILPPKKEIVVSR